MHHTGKGKQTAYYGMILGLALILSYVESLIPIPIPIPGIKLGLANSVILFVLYRNGVWKAAGISILRIILSGFLFGNMAAIIYSLAGAASSILIMYLLQRTKWFSITGVSVAGGVAHNVGQLITAAVIVQTTAVYYYIPVLLLAGAVTGILIGLAAGEIEKRVPDFILKNGGNQNDL